MYLGGSAPSARARARWSSVLDRWSRPRITCVIPSSIVHHRGKVVRGAAPAARGSPRSPRNRTAPPSSYASLLLEQSRGGIAVQRESLALPHRPLSQITEPFEVAQDAGLGPGIDPLDIGIVDPEASSPERSSAKRLFATAVSAEPSGELRSGWARSALGSRAESRALAVLRLARLIS